MWLELLPLAGLGVQGGLILVQHRWVKQTRAAQTELRAEYDAIEHQLELLDEELKAHEAEELSALAAGLVDDQGAGAHVLATLDNADQPLTIDYVAAAAGLSIGRVGLAVAKLYKGRAIVILDDELEITVRGRDVLLGLGRTRLHAFTH